MQGSLYPDGCTVDRVALRRTEQTKAAEILRGRVDWTSRGLYVGGEVTVNTTSVPNLNIDVKQFAGFAPNGEFVDVPYDYYNLPLADYALGAVNLVVAVYTEVETQKQPHETRGVTYPTRADASRRLRIFSAAQYAALPSTDSNLANDARDRCLVLAKVTANGVGVAITSASIQSPTSFQNILYANPRTFTNLPGVEIIGVSPKSPVGNGTLTYNFVLGTYSLQWTTSNGAGAVVNPTADGIYNITDGAGEYIRVLIGFSSLPVSGTFPITETVTIINLYYQDIPRLTAEDWLHRNFLGTGVLTPQNPHALSLDDIAGPTLTLLNEHQDIEHCNGIWKGSNALYLSTAVNNLPVADAINIVGPVAGDLYYVNGVKNSKIDVTTLAFATPPVPPLGPNAYLYEIYVSDEGTVEYTQKAAYPNPRTITGTWIVAMSPDYPFGSANLQLSRVVNDYTFTWALGTSVLISNPGAGDSQIIRLYAADSFHWIDLYVNFSGGTPDETLPGAGNYTDLITINASLDSGQNMRIASTSFRYDPASLKWFAGYPPTSVSRFTIDQRTWGTTCISNMADAALEYMAHAPNNELGRSGVLLRRNGPWSEFRFTYGGTGLNADISGGSYYCRGKRLDIQDVTTVAFAPNCKSLVWADYTGVIHVMNVTASFGGNITSAMKYILGSPTSVPPNTNVYHHNDNIDPPERGVILWYAESDPANLTRTKEFTRNVNQVDDPWSVGSRSGFFAYYPTQAAFDSLFAAFEYAKYEMLGSGAGLGPYRTASIEIHVTGSTFIDSEIVQPMNVNVSGTRGASTTLARVDVFHTLANGTWALSAGCQVHDLTIDMWVSGAVFRLDNNVVIERCLYTAAPLPITDALIALHDGSGSPAKNGVRIRDNIVTTNACMIGNTLPAAGGYIDFSITGNHVTVRDGSSYAAIWMTSCAGVDISKNIIEVINTNDTQAPGIQVGSIPPFQTRDVSIRDNVIATNNKTLTQAVAPVGILLYNTIFCSVSGNSIYPSLAVAPTSPVITGIHLAGCSNISVHDNRLNLMGVGVHVGDYFYDIEIYRNKFVGCLHRGVRATVSSYPLGVVYGLRVEDNDMFLFAKGSDPGALFDANLIGVEVDLSSLSSGAFGVTGVSICRNAMGAFGSASGGLRGVSIEINTTAATTQESFKLDGNIMTGFMGATHSNVGIYIFGTAAGTNNLQHFSACQNSIVLSTASTLNFVSGIAINKSLDSAVVDDNVVHIMSGGTNSIGIGICIGYPFQVSTRLNVSDNEVNVEASSGIYVCAFFAIVANNQVWSYGEGIFVRVFQHSKLLGNRVVSYAFSENPFIGIGAGPGTHCIAISDNESDFSFENNTCHLVGVGAMGALDIPENSACIKIQGGYRFSVDGSRTEVDADTVAAPAVGKQAYGIYFRAKAVVPGSPVQASFRNNEIYNDYRYKNSGGALAAVNGLFIDRDAAWNCNTDFIRVSVFGNVIHCGTDCTVLGAGMFNEEVVGAGGPPTVPVNPPVALPANYPYDFFVNWFGALPFPGALVHAKNAQVLLDGNQLFVYWNNTTVHGPNVYAAYQNPSSSNLGNYKDGWVSGDWW